MHWIDKAPGEVGGMGTITFNEEGNYFHVRDVYLLEQEVTGGTTDLDEKALGKLEYELHKQKIKGDLNFWWHSHANMQVVWSQQDKETIEQIGEQGYCVATVLNKRREMRSAVCSLLETNYGHSGTQFTDELSTIIHDHVDPKEIAQWDKDFDERVKEKKFVYTPPATTHSTSTNGTKDKPTGDYENIRNISTKNWEQPPPEKVRRIFDEWAQKNPNAIPNDMDKELIVGAAASCYNLSHYNFIEQHLTYEDWIKLDTYVQAFNKQHVDFDWRIT